MPAETRGHAVEHRFNTIPSGSTCTVTETATGSRPAVARLLEFSLSTIVAGLLLLGASRYRPTRRR